MSLKDSFANYSGPVVKSYSSLTHKEIYTIASCDSLLESITELRKIIGNIPGMLASDKSFCEKVRGELLMGRLRKI